MPGKDKGVSSREKVPFSRKYSSSQEGNGSNQEASLGQKGAVANQKISESRDDVLSHTRRYRKTDEKLLSVAYRISGATRKTRITVKELARQARVSTSTFYRHFRNLLDFSRRHERAIREATERLLAESSGGSLDPGGVFFKVNRMFYLNRSSVRLLLANNNDRAVRWAFWAIRPLIVRGWPTYGLVSDRKIYCFFVAEATEAVKLWVVNYGFRQSYIEDITRQLVFISKMTAPMLAPLMKMEDEKGLRVSNDYM